MTRICSLFIATVLTAGICSADDIDLFVVAGQSNAQGWKGDGAHYPKDLEGVDKDIPLYWLTPSPKRSMSSNGKWVTLQPQAGRFKKGHFGLEVTFARSLKKAGYNPAIFKCSQGSTSLANNWKGPGDGKMYDQMAKEFGKAISLLKKAGHTVTVRCLVWIQGESDGQNAAMANAYKANLKRLINDFRNQVTKEPELPILLGVDEQHQWMKKQPQVIAAQKALAKEDKHIVFTSMVGLEKADSTHLTPKGLEEHGKRIYTAYSKLVGKKPEKSSGKK